MKPHKPETISGRWFSKGTHLFQAHEGLLSLLEGPKAFEPVIIVGKPVAANATPDIPPEVMDRRMIAEMIYAFAVECWLKGILVASHPHEESLYFRKIAEEVGHMEGEDFETYLSRSEEVYEKADYPLLEAIDARNRQQREDAIEEILRKHSTHDLVRLAEAAEVTSLGEHERKYLMALSVAVQLGRYPATRFETKINFMKIWARPQSKVNLNQAIRDRYIAVER